MFSRIERFLDHFLHRLDIVRETFILSAITMAVLGSIASSSFAMAMAGGLLAMAFIKPEKPREDHFALNPPLSDSGTITRPLWRRCDFALAPLVMGDIWIKTMDMEAANQAPVVKRKEREAEKNVAMTTPLAALLLLAAGQYMAMPCLLPWLFPKFRQFAVAMAIALAVIFAVTVKPPMSAVLVSACLFPALFSSFVASVSLFILATGFVVLDMASLGTWMQWPCLLLALPSMGLCLSKKPMAVLSPLIAGLLFVSILPRFDVALIQGRANFSGVSSMSDPFSNNGVMPRNKLAAIMPAKGMADKYAVYVMDKLTIVHGQPKWQGEIVRFGENPIFARHDFPRSKPYATFGENAWQLGQGSVSLPEDEALSPIFELLDASKGKPKETRALELLNTLRAWRYDTRGKDLASFIKTRQGYCAMYASVYAIALRRLDIPSAVVTGYIPKPGEAPRTHDLFDDNAHAWVVAKINGVWITLDPTPPRPNTPIWITRLSMAMDKAPLAAFMQKHPWIIPVSLVFFLVIRASPLRQGFKWRLVSLALSIIFLTRERHFAKRFRLIFGKRLGDRMSFAFFRARYGKTVGRK